MEEDPLQYSCLDNSIDKKDWRSTVHGVEKSQTPLSKYALLQSLFPSLGPTKNPALKINVYFYFIYKLPISEQPLYDFL